MNKLLATRVMLSIVTTVIPFALFGSSQDVGPPGGWGIALVSDSERGVVYAGFHGGGVTALGRSRRTDRNVGPPEKTVVAIAVDPDRAGNLYVGTEKGLYVSRDGGTTWDQKGSTLIVRDIWSLAIDPADHNTLYAGTAGGGVYKTTDRAVRWTYLAPTKNIVVTSVLATAGPHRVVYAGTLGDGILSSIDGGLHWAAEKGLVTRRVFSLTMNPGNASIILAGTSDGIVQSIIGSGEWSPELSGPVGTAVYCFAADRADAVIYAGTARGLFVSNDSGTTWEGPSKDSEHTMVWSLAVDPRVRGHLYLGELGGGLQESFDHGRSLFSIKTRAAHQIVHSIANAPIGERTMYAGTAGGGVFKSVDHGNSWSAANEGLENRIVTSLATDPARRGIVYAATQKQFLGPGGGVFKTSNAGATWHQLGVNNRRIFCIAVDFADPRQIIAGSDDGTVLQSVDDGETWHAVKVNVDEVKSNDSAVQQSMHPGAVFAIATSHSSNKLIYAGTDSGVFRSDDGGYTWSARDNGLTDKRVRSLIVDPENDKLVYVGTGDESRAGAVFKSNDGGATWLATTLTEKWILSLLSSGSSVYAGTDTGVYVSTDAGKHWRLIGGTEVKYVLTMSVDQFNSKIIYAGTEGQGIIKIEESFR